MTTLRATITPDQSLLYAAAVIVCLTALCVALLLTAPADVTAGVVSPASTATTVDPRERVAYALLSPDHPSLPADRAAVDRAVDLLASAIVAGWSGLDSAVADGYREQAAAELRQSLTVDELAHALLCQLHEQADARARSLLDDVLALPTYQEGPR